MTSVSSQKHKRIRLDASSYKVVEYVLNNPVRRGLVRIHFQDHWFSHCGARAGDKPLHYAVMCPSGARAGDKPPRYRMAFRRSRGTTLAPQIV